MLLIDIGGIVELGVSVLMVGVEGVVAGCHHVVAVGVVGDGDVGLLGGCSVGVGDGEVELLLLDLLVCVVELPDLVLVVVQLQVVVLLQHHWLAGRCCSRGGRCSVRTLSDAVQGTHSGVGWVFPHHSQLRGVALASLDLGAAAVHSQGISLMLLLLLLHELMLLTQTSIRGMNYC